MVAERYVSCCGSYERMPVIAWAVPAAARPCRAWAGAGRIVRRQRALVAAWLERAALKRFKRDLYDLVIGLGALGIFNRM